MKNKKGKHMGAIDYLKKHGGKKLIKHYITTGTFLTACCEFFLLGKSRTALEILRLAVQCKIKTKIENEFKNELKNFNDSYNTSVEHISSNKVWICWFQGIDNAPNLVKRCFQSVKENLYDKDVILITSENMFDYVDFPDFVIHKWKQGIITHTHMTDLLRLELLIKYGGIWMDATVFCSEKSKDIPHYFFDSDLFMYQCLKPGRDGHTHMASSWLISAKTNNKILMGTRHLCYEYWKKYNKMVDYFLLHIFVTMMLESNPDDWKAIVPKDNASPHVLLLRLFDEFDENIWDAIRKQTPFHKLTYKYEEELTQIKGTYYDKLFNR